mmetsp:Transcript_17042/g.45511  ORF Transcript_17042/g.45511 Transcript_17042/m.45511 type:complete len:322 (+) Transcript_17042:953-1918(+)
MFCPRHSVVHLLESELLPIVDEMGLRPEEAVGGCLHILARVAAEERDGAIAVVDPDELLPRVGGGSVRPQIAVWFACDIILVVAQQRDGVVALLHNFEGLPQVSLIPVGFHPPAMEPVSDDVFAVVALQGDGGTTGRAVRVAVLVQGLAAPRRAMLLRVVVVFADNAALPACSIVLVLLETHHVRAFAALGLDAVVRAAVQGALLLGLVKLRDPGRRPAAQRQALAAGSTPAPEIPGAYADEEKGSSSGSQGDAPQPGRPLLPSLPEQSMELAALTAVDLRCRGCHDRGPCLQLALCIVAHHIQLRHQMKSVEVLALERSL